MSKKKQIEMKDFHEIRDKSGEIERVISVDNIGGMNINIARYSNYDYPSHTHSFNELIIVFGGTGIHVVNGKIYTLVAGDVFVLKNDDYHELKNTKNLEFCNIIYFSNAMEYFGNDIKVLPAYHDLFVFKPYFRNKRKASAVFRLNTSQLNYVKGLVEAMENEFESKFIASETMLTAYFMHLVVYLCRQYEVTYSELTEMDFEIAHALSHLEANYSESLSVKQLAKIANMSASHFNKTFNDVLNISPMQYLKQLRIKKACLLLTHTKLSITEIAALVGIGDSNYFARTFKSIIGLSPKQYRDLID